jgi:FKBP-type peptidyl-prolyl cis-trans isomerase (trigger factor)
MESFINLVRTKFFDLILEKNSFEVPKSLINKEVQERLEHNKKKDPSEQKSEKDIEKESIKAFSIWYLIKDVAEQNNISVEDSEVQDFIFKAAVRENVGDPRLIFQIYNSNPKLKDSISQKLKEDKVISFLLEKTSKKTKKMSKSEFTDYLKLLNETKGDAWKIKKKGIF